MRGDRRGGLQRLVEQLGGRHDAGDEARALGFGGVHHPAGQAHLHRLGLADRAGQALRSAHAGRDAELDLGLAELRAVGGDDEVGHHRQLAAAAQREAGDRGDPRLAGRRDLSPSRRRNCRRYIAAKPWSDISLMSAPAAKALSLPVSTAQRWLSSASKAAKASISSAEHLAVQRVQRLRAVERDQRDRAALFDQDGFVAS